MAEEMCAHGVDEDHACDKCDEAGDDCRWNDGGECWCEVA